MVNAERIAPKYCEGTPMRHLSSVSAGGFLLAIFLILSSTMRGAGAIAARGGRQAARVATFSGLPIVFEPNVGQTELPARFTGRSGPLEIELYSHGFGLRSRGKGTRPMDIKVDFLNCPADTNITASEHKPSVTNYLLGRDPSGWRTHVANFGRVTYSHLYPGIDAVFYGNGGQLEHDFVVAPHADYHRIRLQVRGARHVSLTSNGDLRLAVEDGNLFFQRPAVYQTASYGRQYRHGRFDLLENHEIGFEIDGYDRSRPLCIDPSLTYSTYLANLNLTVTSVAADNLGNAYVTGLTFSGGYPVTPGAFQSTCSACAANHPDIFITKVSPDGSTLLYSTLLGGSSYNEPSKIAVDASGNAVVTGWTESIDFPLKNPIPYSNLGGTGLILGFITSLSPDGASLNYSSILGAPAAPYGSPSTYANGVALDASGNAYVTGTTDSPVYPVTAGALNLVSPANPENNVFVSKFSPTGSLVYSAVLGNVDPQPAEGEGPFGVMAIAVDDAGAAYVAGAAGMSWPTTPGAYQPGFSNSADNKAPFVAKLSADASTLLYSTFLGVDAYPTDIKVNGSGEAFVAGVQAASTFPTTSNAYQPTVPGGTTGFFSELDSTGTHLLYSSFFGIEDAYISGIDFDSSGNIWLAGATGDTLFPLVNPVESAPPGITTSGSYPMGFLSQLDPTGSDLLFSTFFGEAPVGARINAFALNSKGKVFFAGLAYGDFFTTPGAYLGTVTLPTTPDTTYSYGYVASLDTSVGLNAGYGSTLTFDGQLVNSTSSAQIVPLINSGTTTLNITSIAVTGDFAQTNPCGSSVLVGKSCGIAVTFTPTAVGTRTGTLTVTDNAPSSPQTVNLVGTGQDFTLAVASGSPSSATVTAGQAASYSLSLSGLGGMAQTITFTCSGAPSAATCAVNPSTMTPAGAGAASLAVAVTTTARSLAAPPQQGVPPINPDVAWKLTPLLLLGMLIAVSIARRLPGTKLAASSLRFGLSIATLLVLALIMATCGGGSGGGGGGTPPQTGTPAGNYTLTVTGAASGLQHGTTLTLTVN